MGGVSLSLACNGNSTICCGFSTLTNLSSLSPLPLEPTDKASPCAGSQFNNHSNKKGLPKVVLFYYWCEQSTEQEARVDSHPYLNFDKLVVSKTAQTFTPSLFLQKAANFAVILYKKTPKYLFIRVF